MKTLTLQSNKSNFYSNILRVGIGIIGSMYLVTAVQTYLSTYELGGLTIMNGSLGLIILLVVIFNPTFGAHIKLLLTDKFLRTKEDLSMIRTAYWNKISRLTLTRFSIRIKYQSGTSERFRLPFVKGDEHTELKKRLQEISSEYKFEFCERPW